MSSQTTGNVERKREREENNNEYDGDDKGGDFSVLICHLEIILPEYVISACVMASSPVPDSITTYGKIILPFFVMAIKYLTLAE